MKDIFNASEWVALVEKAKDLFKWTNETAMFFVENALSDGAYDWFHDKVSISSTLYARVFLTNIVLAAFSSYMYVTCKWKKLPKRRSYEKFVCKNVDEIIITGKLFKK